MAKTYNREEVIQQIWEAEGVMVEISGDFVATLSYTEVFPERMSNRATVADLQERIGKFLEVAATWTH